jgi:hypothetical protein
MRVTSSWKKQQTIYWRAGSWAPVLSWVKNNLLIHRLVSCWTDFHIPAVAPAVLHHLHMSLKYKNRYRFWNDELWRKNWGGGFFGFEHNGTCHFSFGSRHLIAKILVIVCYEKYLSLAQIRRIAWNWMKALLPPLMQLYLFYFFKRGRWKKISWIC